MRITSANNLGHAGERRHKDETHEIAARKLQQMEKLRGAFGIGADVNEGDAFNPEVQEAKRQAERDRREAEKQVCRGAVGLERPSCEQ